MCNGEPVWPHIMKSKDFQELSPYPENRVPPKTKFSIIKTEKMRYVLAVDMSISMQVYGHIESLQHAAKEWLSGDATDKDEVGIVGFG